jgi:AraC-like DNA-binding protein
MKIYIKDMMCLRCKVVVKSVLEKVGLEYTTVELGHVELAKEASSKELDVLNDELQKFELSLIKNRKNSLVESIKTVIIELVAANDELRIKFSDYLSQKLNYNYTYLANVFSEIEGSSIEKFYIIRKIERVKRLMMYDNMSISEVAYKMHYSSVAHLSSQFKKVTGLTPSEFKKQFIANDFDSNL